MRKQKQEQEQESGVCCATVRPYSTVLALLAVCSMCSSSFLGDRRPLTVASVITTYLGTLVW